MSTSCMGMTDTAGGAASSGSGMTMMIFPILLIVIFIVLIIVPNKRKEKQFKNMLDNLRVGDMIKTIGGFYGRLVSVKEDLITIECGPDKTKLVLAKGAIASVESFDEGKELPAEKPKDKKEEPEEEIAEEKPKGEKKEKNKN